MSTGTKNRLGPMTNPPSQKPRGDKQLRRDRTMAIVVLAVMAAVLAFIIWLASISGGTGHEGIDYWPMMP